MANKHPITHGHIPYCTACGTTAKLQDNKYWYCPNEECANNCYINGIDDIHFTTSKSKEITMTDEQPVFTCPSCGKNIFDVGVTECATGADISTVIDFKQSYLNAHETQIGSAEHQWVKCNNCHNGINIDVDQLDAVFSGRCTEEQMKIQCKIIQRPVFRCPQCRVDIFKAGFNEITYGGTTKSEITLCSDGYDTEPAEVSNFTEQWSECGNCGARIDINADNLINYYNGDCSLEDLVSE